MPEQAFQHSKELIKAFTPIRFFLTLIGQMPFDIKKKADNTYSFRLNYISKSYFFFLLMFTLTTSVYCVVTWGIVVFMLDKKFTGLIRKTPDFLILVKDPVTGDNESQLWERFNTRAEMIPVLVIWSWMTISTVGSIHRITYGKFYVHYMNYFNRVVQLVDINMAYGIRKYLWKTNMITILITISFIVGFSLDRFGFHPVRNSATMLMNFVLRIFGKEMPRLKENERFMYQILGLLIMILALVGSRANVIQFLFFSQLLKNGTKVWNQRLALVLEIDQVTLREQGCMDAHSKQNDQFHRRLDLKHILKDHLILVQLFRMTESVFGFILLVFYCFEIVAVVMEVYQLASFGGFSVNITLLQDDGIPSDHGQFEADKTDELNTMYAAIESIVMMFQHIWFAISTTTVAAQAYEQAMEGFNILRRHGFMYTRNKQDRNFILSLLMSFAKNAPMQLTAGGYFIINKALLVAMSAAIVNWAVSIYQTKVDQWK